MCVNRFDRSAHDRRVVITYTVYAVAPVRSFATNPTKTVGGAVWGFCGGGGRGDGRMMNG